MITVDELNDASDADFVTLLGGIYEHSDWVPRRILQQRPFPNRRELQSALKAVVETSGGDAQLALIRAHPDLAGKLARAGTLTAESPPNKHGWDSTASVRIPTSPFLGSMKPTSSASDFHSSSAPASLPKTGFCKLSQNV
jgi:hypothetical protein